MDLKSLREYFKIKSQEENKYFLMGSRYADEIFDDDRIDEGGIVFFRGLFQEWDAFGSVPLELGCYVEQLLDEPSIVLGIHRTGGFGSIDKDNILESKMLNSIFKDGLKNMGHLSSGAVSDGTPDPSYTVSMIANPLYAMMFLKGSYKDSVGGVLVALPSSCVDNEGKVINNSFDTIYTMVDNSPAIKPEYLLGFVASNNGECTYYPKEKFVNKNKNL